MLLLLPAGWLAGWLLPDWLGDWLAVAAGWLPGWLLRALAVWLLLENWPAAAAWLLALMLRLLTDCSIGCLAYMG